jgi:hypothetical protein
MSLFTVLLSILFDTSHSEPVTATPIDTDGGHPTGGGGCIIALVVL